MLKRMLPVFILICLMLTAFIPAALAADENPKLSLNDAIKMALERNRDLKVQKLSINKATEQLDDTKDNVKELSGNYDPNESAAWASYLTAIENERIAEHTLEYMKQQMVVDVKELYYDVLSGKRKIELSETALRVAQIELAQARTKYRLGMITQADLLSFETKLASAESDLVTAKNALEDSYTKLNNLIGASDGARPELVDDAVFEKEQFSSMDEAIAQALSQNHQIWAAERSAEVAREIRIHANNYNVGDLDSKIKAVEAGDVKEQIREQVKSLYLSLKSLEKAYAAQEQQVALLNETLRIVKVQREVGMATDLQVRKAEQSYFDALDGLRQMVYQYDTAKAQLQVLTVNDILPQEV